MHIIAYGARDIKEKPPSTQKKYASELFGDSYITGLSAVAKSEGYCRKLVKSAILVCCLVGFFYQTYNFLQLYWKYTTVSNTLKMHNIKKPAVTVCDENLIGRKYFCKAEPNSCETFLEARERMNISDDLCVFYAAYCSDKNDTYEKLPLESVVEYKHEYFKLEFTKESGFQIQDNLKSCYWLYNKGTKKISTKKLENITCSTPKFVRVMNQEKLPAACYTFESAIGESNFTEERITYGSGSMTLRWHTSDLINLAPDRLSGSKIPLRVYYVSFHDPESLSNPYVDGFPVKERKIYKFEISQNEHCRLPPPYSTNCYDYESAWRSNGGKGPLKREDCEEQCEIEENMKANNCVPREVTYPHEFQLCDGTIEYDLTLYKKIQDCVAECREACKESKYTVRSEVIGQISSANAIKVYGTPCVVKLEIVFNILNSKRIRNSPKYESVELFSYIGGFVGMWLGWSLLAIFDFIEIVFMFVKHTLSERKNGKVTDLNT